MTSEKPEPALLFSLGDLILPALTAAAQLPLLLLVLGPTDYASGLALIVLGVPLALAADVFALLWTFRLMFRRRMVGALLMLAPFGVDVFTGYYLHLRHV